MNKTKIYRLIIILGVIIIVIGFLLLSSSILHQTVNVKTSKDYDKWYNVSERKEGDTIVVKGKLDKKENNPMGSGFAYSFHGTDKDFLCNEDIGNNGDIVIVEIEIDSMNLPYAIGYSREYDHLILPSILMIVGVIIILFGFRGGVWRRAKIS